jgi:hypothetical protein
LFPPDGLGQGVIFTTGAKIKFGFLADFITTAA